MLLQARKLKDIFNTWSYGFDQQYVPLGTGQVTFLPPVW